MKDVRSLRQKILGIAKTTTQPIHRPELFNFLGLQHKDRVKNLAQRIIPGEEKQKISAREKRKDIFNYIVEFWERSLLSAPYKSDIGYGLNLAKRPYLTPSGPGTGEHFTFAEQYRWDTYFQNKGLILAGGYDLAKDQLLNLADVFDEYKRIPNALTTVFLSHAQPPLEAISVVDLLEAGFPAGEWSKQMIRVIEEDLLTEWWDFETGKLHKRQVLPTVEKYGLLTRYTRMHFHPLLTGCEDGKDHNWISATYGSDYLPVQLNAIIYQMLTVLIDYFKDEKLGNDKTKADLYRQYQQQLYKDFQKFFWCEKGKWKGFRNYSIHKSSEGSILYGDLSAEVWPLFVGIATEEQAEVIKNNLAKYYAGDLGLATTSLELREGGSIQQEPQGGWTFQWEYPNCWPPLMYVAVEGLKKYGYEKEALDYQKRWIKAVEIEFPIIHGFAEKSPYAQDVPIFEGYYGVVHGFGWTIGVYLDFINDLAKRNLLD